MVWSCAGVVAAGWGGRCRAGDIHCIGGSV